MFKKPFLLAVLLTVSAGTGALAAPANPDAYSPQNVLIGAVPSLQAAANNGKGVTFGIIDTGGTASWVGFEGFNGNSKEGRITSEVCVASCSSSALKSGNIDDNGHGTFVTSEIIGGIPGIGMLGIDPAANAVEIKVLNAQGTGTSTAVSTGIADAVSKGAQILNLSLGPSGTPSQQAAFYSIIASAVNAAAAKGAIIVFAGGNNSQAFADGANITGFTDTAIKHIILMGSTNAAKSLSSFSNTPGAAGFTSTTGKFYAYGTMWMMADGENIWGASNYSTKQYGYDYITQMSGTSMAAPQGAGAAGLLASKWPFLISAGTIPAILEQTATDMGVKGVDTTYGDGFINLTQAMQPASSTLTVPVNGKTQVVSASSNSALSRLIAGASFGNMPQLSLALKHAVGYDSFMRGFSLFSSSPVMSRTEASAISPATAMAFGETGANARSVIELGRGDWLAFSGAPSAPSQAAAYSALTSGPGRAAPNWSYGLSQGGTYVGVGQGTGASLSFSDARWGGKSAFFGTDASASSALLDSVAGANFFSTGFALDDDARVAVSLISANADNLGLTAGPPTSARGAAFAYTMQPSARWKVSMTASFLDENNMLLGSTASSGLINLGASASTMAFGIGANVDLGGGWQAGFDAAYASTATSGSAGSFIGGTSGLSSDSFSVALAKDDVSGAGDRLSVALDKPLRIFAGSASLALPTGTDDNSNPIISHENVSLTPSGSETDFDLSYARPLASNMSTSFDFAYRNDADNVAGLTDAAAMVHLRLSF